MVVSIVDDFFMVDLFSNLSKGKVIDSLFIIYFFVKSWKEGECKNEEVLILRDL